MLKAFLTNVKALLTGRRPPVPTCAKCGDEILLAMEIEQGFCVDCQAPAYERKRGVDYSIVHDAMAPPTADVPRAFGDGTRRL